MAKIDGIWPGFEEVSGTPLYRMHHWPPDVCSGFAKSPRLASTIFLGLLLVVNLPLLTVLLKRWPNIVISETA